jgi:hypothetical protein
VYFSLDAAHTSGGHGWPASSSEEEEIDESESEDEESEEEADDVAELNALLNNASRRDIRKLLITARKDARKSAMCMSILPVRRKVYFAFNGELNPLVNKFCSSVDSDIVIQARNGESELQLETTLKVKYPYRDSDFIGSKGLIRQVREKEIAADDETSSSSSSSEDDSSSGTEEMEMPLEDRNYDSFSDESDQDSDNAMEASADKEAQDGQQAPGYYAPESTSDVDETNEKDGGQFSPHILLRETRAYPIFS